ncbi:DNA-(apurinic or apyrimidinic site) lyase /endonuclease III [Brevinema andersonii]|uniref:Endonuclease III n=1 Tax=Brevinema andersonii TaxID=34097 RepID=A0A1I1D4D8_BREAD|nr:endonuclease III [Brevinema andersonii]SFB69657.1 DNA-(apurinic or apyrimidinic site) lyase /endonuclease III [Brevinema andersonii]
MEETIWNKARFNKIFSILEATPQLKHAPAIHFMKTAGRTPFRILIATILSLRTKDETTAPASGRLFAVADTPEAIAVLPQETIEKLIYPVGFYKTKARNIKKISEILICDFNSQVPADLETLLELPGVGRKTANLVLSVGFDIPAVCVDVHVHRISNRWGFCNTKTPEETEFEIRRRVAEELWSSFNKPIVALGQTICKPITPKCLECPIQDFCEQKIPPRGRK